MKTYYTLQSNKAQGYYLSDDWKEIVNARETQTKSSTYNYWTHTNKKKVEEWAKQNEIVDFEIIKWRG